MQQVGNKKIWGIITGAILTVAAMVAILEYVGIEIKFSKKITNDVVPSTTINSWNQAGGITAQTVNVGKQPRHLSIELKKELLTKLAKEKKVIVYGSMADQESITFSTEINNFLVSEKYNADLILILYNSPPPPPLLINHYEVIVGTNY